MRGITQNSFSGDNYAGKRRFTVFHLFGGAAGGALGFQKAGFETLGGIDFDALSCRDFEMFTGAPEVQMDLWEADTRSIQDACRGQRPDVVFLSPPCKGFSSCLPAKVAATPKYQKMNGLTYHGIKLVVEAWKEPPPLLVMENVPRILVRGQDWLKRIRGLLIGHGYAIDESTHCCGKLGGLAERRKRFLLVARHKKQIPEYLYHPEEQQLKTIGEVIGNLPVPLPGSDAGGPMHRLPRLSAMNWLRIATIRPGKDWRDLPQGPVALNHEPFRGSFGVQGFDEMSATVSGNHNIRTAPGSVADPRLAPRKGRQNGGFGVEGFARTSRAVVAEGSVRNTPSSVADPRLMHSPRAGSHGVEGWADAAHTIQGHTSVGHNFAAVADVRLNKKAFTPAYGVSAMDGQAYAVTASACHDNGSWCVTDPRVTCERREGSLGVQRMDQPSAPIISAATLHNWPAGVADGRLLEATHWLTDNPITLVGPEMDFDSKKPIYMVIQARDGTVHRPLTTLELAAIQSFPTEWNGKPLEMAGKSHASWRQRIGNAVPPEAAFAMAVEFRICLEVAGMMLTPHRTGNVWVSPSAVEMQAGAPG